MRLRRQGLLVSAVLALSACSLYLGGSDHTAHITGPDAAISDDGGGQTGNDGGCGGALDGGSYGEPDAGGYGGPDAGYTFDAGGYGGVDAGGYGGPDGGLLNDGGYALPDAP